MTKFVQNTADIRKNLLTMRQYLTSAKEEERFFARDRLRRGYNLVGGRVDGEPIFGPSRVVGYKNITLKKHQELSDNQELDGRETSPVINGIIGEQVDVRDDRWKDLEELYLAFCEKIDVMPVNRTRKFWVLDDIVQTVTEPHLEFDEGGLSFYVSTRYERSAEARKACIDAHGLSCVVCGLNFEDVYGALGKGFIHVHHRQPLSKLQAGAKTDPVKDLVPVCPNCHYMLHRNGNLLSPEALKKIMKK